MKSGQQNKKTLLIFALFLAGLCNYAFSQSWLLNGNANVAAGTNYLGTKDPNDLVFRTNALERGRVFGVGGAWRFGSSANNAQIDSMGRLTFAGSGKYLVGGNKYVFQYNTTPNYGLFFNSTAPQYEFRNSAATPVFTVNASTGAGAFASTLKIGAYTLPATDGTNGQVLKTNGSGVVSWGNTNNNFWSLTGNAGTNISTNFIGTTDNRAFVLRTNNLERMRIGAAGNVGIGTTTPQANLTVVGTNYVSLTTAGYLQLGDSASSNIGMDYNQIQARYNGGANDLYLNNSGGTTYLGSSSNSYYGGIGYGSQYGLYGYTPGSTGVYGQGSSYGGYFYNANGIGVYGYDAGNGHGVYGYETGSGEGVDGFAYGSAGWGVEAYSSLSYGLYASTGSGSYAGYFNGSVLTSGSYVTSDEKLKQNIQDFSGAMDIIGKLHPRQYNFRQDGSYKLMNLPQEQQYGLIAQDVEKLLPGLVKETKFDVDKASNVAPHAALDPKNKDAQKIAEPKKTGVTIDYKALNYTELIPIMIKGMQEQQKEIEDLKATIAVLSGGKTISSVATGNSDMVSNVSISSALLDQNVPNPLNNTTSIRYNVPAGNASLLITDMNGKSIKTVTLQKGAGVVNIDASTLSAGAYSYTLIIDGKTIATKKMMVAH